MIRALLFDLDGTLIDSTADLAASGNYLRQRRGLPLAAEATVASYIGRGVHRLVADLLSINIEDNAEIDKAVREYILHYHEHCLDHTVLYEGVEETLRLLASAGFAMAVVTNKPERISAHIIKGLKLDDLFKVIIGGNTGRMKKPDAEPLRLACERLKVPLAEALMIGDSHVDVQAAKNALIPCIAVSYGIGDTERLKASKPDTIVESFAKIASLLGKAPARL